MARYRSCPAAYQSGVHAGDDECWVISRARPGQYIKEQQALTGVPDLRLDRLAVDVDAPCSKLYADGRLALQVELVARESR